MKPSSIGLAAAACLTIALLGPASAESIPRQHFASHIGVVSMVRAAHSERFAGRDGEFHRDRDREGALFGATYQTAPFLSPDAVAQPFGLVGGAPIINVTVVSAAPSAGYWPARNYSANPGPKIILLGARHRSTHLGKMPIIVYGRPPIDSTY